jgi:uracil phosphoribosyltransferase
VSDSPQEFANFHLVSHPLLEHKMTWLRRAETPSSLFRRLVDEISAMLAVEATRDLGLAATTIQTPLAPYHGGVLAKKPVILPILRAGNGMLNAFLSLLPEAQVGQIGLFRDEQTFEPHRYYFKIPKKTGKQHYFVVDPMLATGNSAVAAIDKLKEENIHDITFVCIVAAPEGMQHFCQAHPDVPVYCASLDEGLNQHSYILPGLGDAGDRIFGTE